MHIIKKQTSIPNDFIAASEKHFSGRSSPHVHEFFEIEYVIDGEGICAIDGIEYPMRRGALFLLTPISTHAVRSADAQIINVMFRCDYDGELVLPPFVGGEAVPPFFLEDFDAELVCRMLSELVAVHGSDVIYARMLLSCVLQKLNRFAAVGNHAPLPYMQRAFLYITENFRHGITLRSAAAHLGLSPTYFSDLFSREAGMCFKTYLDHVRFSHAQGLLAFTDLPIRVVHEQSGFSDYANFSRRFRQIHGISPGEYRKRCAGETGKC